MAKDEKKAAPEKRPLTDAERRQIEANRAVITAAHPPRHMPWPPAEEAVMAKPKVPNTISDKEWSALQRRAAKVEPPWTSRKAVTKRLASNLQRQKRGSS
jgi:hypothetical protein